MRISNINKAHIFVTMGDPAGIGPEVVIKALDGLNDINDLCVVVIGDSGLLKKLHKGKALKPLSFLPVDFLDSDLSLSPDTINVIDPGPVLEEVSPGVPNKGATIKSLRSLDMAIEFIKKMPSTVPKAMVTAPVNKQNIADILPGFVGHTEYLQKAFDRSHVTMALVGRSFTAVPVTRHIPVKDINRVLTAELLFSTINDVSKNLKMLSLKQEPVVSVCALNPHCGEGGKIGEEENTVIAPVINRVKEMGINISGPVSSDVAFYKARKGEIDVVIGMYHDQCLSPFKMMEFDTGVNTTLGLGFIRTSPDHGTAYDIAGKNIANPDSMKESFKLAVRALK